MAKGSVTRLDHKGSHEHTVNETVPGRNRSPSRCFDSPSDDDEFLSWSSVSVWSVVKEVLCDYQSVLNGIGVHPQWGKHVFQGLHVVVGASEEEKSGELGVSPRSVFK